MPAKILSGKVIADAIKAEVAIEILAPSAYLAGKGPKSEDRQGRRITTNSVSAVIKLSFKGVSPADLSKIVIALAGMQANDKESAASSMSEAERLGLHPDALHPLEREKFERVRKGLPQHNG